MRWENYVIDSVKVNETYESFDRYTRYILLFYKIINFIFLILNNNYYRPLTIVNKLF